MNKRLTVSIGIPAYNEAANIGKLLASLRVQKSDGWRLAEIIVHSDASTDETDKIVTTIKDPTIRLIRSKERIGSAQGQNKIMREVNSDVLIMLNADIKIVDPHWITKMIAPIHDDPQVGLVSCRVLPLPGKTLFSRLINWSHLYKQQIFEHISLSNVHLVHGRARALSKDFYSKHTYPQLMAEDGYSYFKCIELGFKSYYQTQAEIFFMSPGTLRDHLKQSGRYFRGIAELKKYLPAATVHEAFHIPRLSVVYWTVKSLFSHPVYTLSFFTILMLALVVSVKNKLGIGYAWDPSLTSKTLDDKEGKRLDVVTTFFYPVTAGIETNIYKTYTVLARSGWDVYIHTTRDSLTEKNVYKDTEVIDGLKVIRYATSRFGFFPSIPYNKTPLICLHNFNVLPHSAIYAMSLLRKLLGYKTYGIFLTPHGGYTPEWSTFPPLAKLLKQLYHATVGRFAVNFLTDKVRAVSKWEASELRKAGIHKNKIVVMENGLDKDALLEHDARVSVDFKQKVSDYGWYVISIGRVAPIKNYETSIRALALTQTKWNYVIVGPDQDTKYVRKLTDLAEELGLADRVKFVGVIKGSEKYYLIKHAKALLHMAMWESFCNVVFEAMSQKQICIVADNTALKSLVTNHETGIITHTFDEEQLAKAIDAIGRVGSVEVKHIKEKLRRTAFKTWDDTALSMGKQYQLIVEKYAR